MDLSIGICAGGKSRRMGSDKALLKWKGETLAELLYKKFAGDYRVIFSLGSSSDSVNAYISEHLPYAETVFDENKEYGPIEGIRRILEVSGSSNVFICAVDMPFIDVGIVRYMQQFISGDHDCICLEADGRPQPLCAVYSVNSLYVIRELIKRGERRLSALTESLRTKYVGLEYTTFRSDICMNVNDPRQFAVSKLPAVFGVCGYSGSGKTTLICELVKRFALDGLKTAVIKHTVHTHSFDRKGADTERFSEAGAAYSFIFSENGYLLNAAEHTDADTLIKMCKNADVIMIEGMKNAAHIPKILAVSHNSGSPPHNAENIIYTYRTDLCSPVDISEIYKILIEYFDLGMILR